MIQLTPVQQKYVLHWGEMGTQWGINRTVAQIHALLFISPQPLHAEEIAASLQVARSNVSNSIKELMGWGIVRRVHVMGDKRDHFESQKDVWELFRVILDERKKREIDPTIAMLRECVEELDQEGESSRYARERLEELQEFLETTSTWYSQIRKLPNPLLVRLLKAGDSVGTLFQRKK
jgi:DNA-binding transcriptional regulator GbsR (MarR family)